MTPLGDEQVGERGEARLVDFGGCALRLVEELLALAEASELVRASRRDDRGNAFRVFTRHRHCRALFRRRVAALEEGEQRIVQRLAQARARALFAVGTHAARNREQGRDEAREEIERKVAGEHQEDEQVQRELDAVRRGDNDHVTGRLPCQQRDAHRHRREQDRPDGEAHR